MNAAEALGRLRRLGIPAATTADAAATLGLTVTAASQTLRRLAAAGLVTPVRKGLWALVDSPDPLQLAEYVTAPYPGYVSLQTALYRRGLVEQIPSMVFVVSLARSARVVTRIATYSVHHVPPALFGGFVQDRAGVKLAEPEKALVDVLYLSPTKGRLFASLPELELPPEFDWRKARAWAARIPAGRLRTIVERKLEALERAERGATASTSRTPAAPPPRTTARRGSGPDRRRPRTSGS